MAPRKITHQVYAVLVLHYVAYLSYSNTMNDAVCFLT